MGNSGMQETMNQKMETKEHDSELIEILLEYMYKGAVSPSKMRKRTKEILMMANYYEIISLKKIVEVTLIEELDLGNMLEMFILADMYDAQELRLASKNLIMDNLHQLVNIEGWKETTSKNLVCEILEGIGDVRPPKKKAKLSSEIENLLYYPHPHIHDSDSDS